MSEKPGKRLVGWKPYLETVCRRGIVNSLSYVLLGSGLMLLLLCLPLFIGAFCVWNYPGWGVASGLLGGVAAAVGGAMLWSANSLSVKAQQIDQVQLITRHNTGLLPPEESLVRASDLPPSHQQDELLRAAKSGQETPPEEMLRATANRKSEG